MTVYAIAQISIHDRATYNRYAARFMPVLSQFGGTLLAADERPEVIEGEWRREKVVLISFPDRERLDAWVNSPQYKEISRDRQASTHGEVILVHGMTR